MPFMRGERGGSVAVECREPLGFVIGVDRAGRDAVCVECEEPRDLIAGVDMVEGAAHTSTRGTCARGA